MARPVCISSPLAPRHSGRAFGVIISSDYVGTVSQVEARVSPAAFCCRVAFAEVLPRWIPPTEDWARLRRPVLWGLSR